MDSFAYERILVPTDMSEFANLAIRYAALFRERMASQLTLLYADEIYYPADMIEVPMGYYLEKAPETKLQLQQKLREYAGAHALQDAETLVIQESPARAIVRTARDMKAELIVMGTHGRHGWRRAILGSRGG
ncbi:MAG TPA: universal stress protein [Thermoanaerobaculia bacterium]|nr:universal stress protein [Thermoanaerobaculia bacterium]